jgi:hypothetical protein
MSANLRRIRRAEAANAEEARHIPPEPVYDEQRLTAEQRDRVKALLHKARSLSTGKEIDWTKMTDDDLMELQEYYQKAEVK